MANLSKEKRQRMLEFLNIIKDEHKDNDESLKAIYEIENELVSKKYGLLWEEHEEKVNIQMKTHIPVFTENKDKEVIGEVDNPNFNFLLEGDNLHSLKLLEKTHKGKVDVIYIDPPYNTKKEGFTYLDTLVDDNDMFRHSKWLSFMNERLKIAQKLLSSKGSIFISIDDDEQAQLKLLCDEIFGEGNFIGNVIWEKKYSPQNDAKWLSDTHDFIIVYAKDKQNWRPNLLERTEEMNSRYKNPDNDPRGPWKSSDLSVKTYSASCDYPITTPSGRIVNPPTSRCWRTSKENFERLVADNRIWFGTTGNNVPSIKRFLSEVKQGAVCKTIWFRTEVGDNQEGAKNLKDTFKGEAPFTNPKPIRLIQRAIELATNSESVVLDFFAGSGTTGQAVLEYNKYKGGNRKFILCTNNQNDICEQITYTRIDNTINGYGKTEGIPSNLKYYKTNFIPKVQEDEEQSISDNLLNHIKEMVQLENGINIDNDKYHIILTDEDADNIENAWDNYKNLKAIYISKNVLLTSSQERLFSNVDIKTIPDYYFESELREVGEIW